MKKKHLLTFADNTGWAETSAALWKYPSSVKVVIHFVIKLSSPSWSPNEPQKSNVCATPLYPIWPLYPTHRKSYHLLIKYYLFTVNLLMFSKLFLPFLQAVQNKCDKCHTCNCCCKVKVSESPERAVAFSMDKSSFSLQMEFLRCAEWAIFNPLSKQACCMISEKLCLHWALDFFFI